MANRGRTTRSARSPLVRDPSIMTQDGNSDNSIIVSEEGRKHERIQKKRDLWQFVNSLAQGLARVIGEDGKDARAVGRTGGEMEPPNVTYWLV